MLERLDRTIPEFRRKQGLAYPIIGMLALIAMAVFSGVTKGYEDLADYAATLSQGQLRALKFRLDRHTRRVRCPQRSSFAYVLTEVNPERLEQVLLSMAGTSSGTRAGPTGNLGRQANPSCRRGVGQCRQRHGSLAGFHDG